MSEERVERRLAAILAVDVAGYSRLMGEDEEGTLAAMRAVRREIGDPKIREHRGRIVKTTGDGLLVEFASVVDAVRCAVEVQREMVARNANVPVERRLEFRMGINVGDIIIEDGDIFGDGVNIAARLEALAEPGGICVSAAAHDQVRDRLDIGFEDLGEQQVKNIARPVRVYSVGSRSSGPQEGEMQPALTAPTSLSRPEKPSIAVLPFQNMSGDPEQEYFADGMVEEIITALSRIPWLFVIARNSTFTYKGQVIDVKRVGRELGVRYILEGSVRRGGGRIRITAQLIEAETGAHLWADRFDGSLEDVFDLQDQVATSVAGVIEPTLQVAEFSRAASRPTTDLTAHDLYLRANALVFSRARQIPEAMGLLAQATTRDPNYGPALALYGLCYFLCCLDGKTLGDWGPDTRKSVDLARRALRAAENDPTTLAKCGDHAGLLRRRHRGHAWAGRSRPGDQPEFGTRMARKGPFEPVGRRNRVGEQIRRRLGAAQPARPHRVGAPSVRCGASHRNTLSRGGAAPPPSNRGRAGFHRAASLARGMLCASRTDRRGTRSSRTSTLIHPDGRAAGDPLPQRSASRSLFYRSEACGGRGGITTLTARPCFWPQKSRSARYRRCFALKVRMARLRA